jgi:DNA-directed RNA polymerase subunit L
MSTSTKHLTQATTHKFMPTITQLNIQTEPTKLMFTLAGINVSIANSIRRTILSDINTVIVRTTPHEKNDANILINTTRLNNEIIGQRLSCIPIHLEPNPELLKHLILEVNVENSTNSIIIVTTEHFRIKHAETEEYLPEEKVREIFPPNDITQDFIEFVHLPPKTMSSSSGGHIHFTATFSISSANENAMFNVVSTCSYANTVDNTNITIQSKNKLSELASNKSLTDSERDMAFHNWKVLDSKRIFLKDSFDFVIESIGVFQNKDIFTSACNKLIEGVMHIRNTIARGDLSVNESDTTMQNCYDITLKNEGYTLGKAFEYMMFANFYENADASPTALTFCGFQKLHPHDANCIIRVAYKTKQPKTTVSQNMLECASDLMDLYTAIKAKGSNL